MNKVLVVDDNVVNLTIAREILDGFEYEIHFATDGKTALQVVKDSKPDLILLDIMMPDIDGFEVCKKLKSDDTTAEIPVIFMTALGSHENILKGFDIGAVDYIIKPFNENEFLARVRTHLNISDMRSQIELQNKELEIKNNELNKSLEFKNHIIAMSSHEIRRPMTMIAMLAQISEKRCLKNGLDDVAKDCHEIRQLVMNATAMLDEFILTAKADLKQINFSPTLINIRSLCETIIEESKLLTDHEYNIIFKYESQHEKMSADQKLLHHILSNILSNAIKYSRDSIEIEFIFRTENKNGIFIIKDNGIGIPEKDKQSLFQEFSRADNVGSINGNGLGLSIVKEFVSLHSGEIEFESQENEGTTFTVTLPLYQEI